MQETKTYVSPQELAEQLNISLPTVWRWLREHRLPAVKIGRVYRIPADAIEQALQPVIGR